jgi:restriction endonuclease S subunit
MAEKTLKLKNIEKLLDEQTKVILSAVDEKISKLERRIARLEIKVDKRFDQLVTTLDKFLKRLTDIEDEFAIIKLEINRLKKVIREKLGVDLL